MGVAHPGNGTRTQECAHVHGKALRTSFRDAGAVRVDEPSLDEVRQLAGTGEEETEVITCESKRWERAMTTLDHNMAAVIQCGFQLVEWGLCVNRSARDKPNALQHG